ncbi:hypothetical protein ACFQ1E_17285 [Sphingomonas canadensis]|uniref:Uncharacterized protein n=1 Tax=Sphingomonas canadensis TaxID=1219257 RepID=A0ABW3HBN7_9SPHN|nr:hypothetical protein [Sphingomonas canadensis]MCW3837801.1 hypothetical protein [Sphingomonas canadensis]
MIDLTALKCQAAPVRLIDWGVMQRPSGPGPTARVGRVGTRFGIEYVAPPEEIEPDGRRWIARLQQAKQQGARVLYPQVEFNVGAPGAPTVDGAVSGGMSLPITGAAANYAIREGQALNVVRSGRTYLHFAAAQTILDASGDGTIALTTPLRAVLAGGESVELKNPAIEGWLTGDEFSWTLELARTVGLSFAIEER